MDKKLLAPLAITGPVVGLVIGFIAGMVAGKSLAKSQSALDALAGQDLEPQTEQPSEDYAPSDRAGVLASFAESQSWPATTGQDGMDSLQDQCQKRALTFLRKGPYLERVGPVQWRLITPFAAGKQTGEGITLFPVWTLGPEGRWKPGNKTAGAVLDGSLAQGVAESGQIALRNWAFDSDGGVSR